MTPEERTQKEAYLKEAETALHKLSIGGQARVVVDQNGERVEFFASNRASLRAYITELRIELGKPSGIVGPAGVRI